METSRSLVWKQQMCGCPHGTVSAKTAATSSFTVFSPQKSDCQRCLLQWRRLLDSLQETMKSTWP